MSALYTRTPRISPRPMPRIRHLKAITSPVFTPIAAAIPLPTGRASARHFTYIIAGIFIGGLLLGLIVNTQVQQVAFQKHALQIQMSQAIAERQRLEGVVAGAESPENLLTIAKRMGMVPAANPVFLRLSDHAILGAKNAAR